MTMSYESSKPNIDGRYGDQAADRSADRPVVEEARPVVYEERTKPARTSIAAALALAIGVAALVCALVIVLGPIALIAGIVGVVLSIFGIRNGGRHGITGRGVAIAALIISLVAAVLGGAIVAGISTVLTDSAAVDRIENQLNQWRDNLPDNVNIPS
jgi:hypothetical protein